MRLGILKSFSEIDDLIQSYIDACKLEGVDFVLLDLLDENWIENIIDSRVDGILVRVKGNIQEQKSLFDERLMIINEELGIPIYPTRKELYLYENKRMYAYWLQVNNLPHVATHIFYTKQTAFKFLDTAKFPLVFKTNTGASSSGVQIVKSKLLAKWYLHLIFGFFDARLSFGKTSFGKLGFLPIPKFGMSQKHYAIIQDFIPIKWEWRIIKIGDSYFGHQKLLKGLFASGSDLIGWVKPPKELLYLVMRVCDIGKFDSMAMDVFESIEGEYYINELQSLFGSFLPFQMRIDNIPGRYVYIDGEFVFEKGEYNILNSNVLRVKDFMGKLKNNNYFFNKLNK